MDIKVENNVPVPMNVGSKPRKYPWDTLAVGESFLTIGPQLNSMQVLCTHRRTETKRFIARREGDGVRVWRVS